MSRVRVLATFSSTIHTAQRRQHFHTRVAIVGAGITGSSTAYSLVKNHGISDILLIEALPRPMAFTSAQSGENYRNWWPHPTMTQLMNRSIDLMEEIATMHKDLSLKRSGYLLATRCSNKVGDILQHLEESKEQVRVHRHFPSLETDSVEALIHIRRAGDVGGFELGSYMLDYARKIGNGQLWTNTTVKDIQRDNESSIYQIHVVPTGKEFEGCGTANVVSADQIVIAAGPMSNSVAGMLGVKLPIHNVFHQKVAFEDSFGGIPRTLPFTIDLDPQHLDWTAEEREALMEDPILSWVANEMPGAVHCRPEGGVHGKWVKLGWAFNTTPTEDPSFDHSSFLHDAFPELVLRGATRLHPKLRAYYDGIPRKIHHYGGWYSMTEENWPIVGPLGNGHEGVFLNCAPSGFGTMSACGVGELCATWIAGSQLPSYAKDFSLSRYHDTKLMEKLRSGERGLL